MKKLSIKIIRKSLAALALFMIVVPFSAALAQQVSTPAAYGIDTIAGYTTLLTTSQTAANADGSFYVKKPDNSIVSIPFKTDSNGTGKADLSNLHTQKAGQYAVAAKLNQQNAIGTPHYFTVYPETLSADSSIIKADQTMAKADGNDEMNITVHLQDTFANPLSGRIVHLLSSRSGDKIEAITQEGITDKNGEMVFRVSSSQPGLSTFSAMDATSNTTLTSRIQGAFIGENSFLNDAGGDDNFFPVAYAQEAGQVYGFEISEIPATIQPNQNISFRVTAQDQNKNTVQNYMGTIHISADSSNVTLPQDYTFTAEDLGTHQFSLGLKFTSAGTYKVTVTDINNQIVKGEKSVVVGSSNSQPVNNQPGTKPTITTPAPGTFSQNIQTINGKAAAGSMVKIYDNEQEIGSIQTGSNGTFSFQTSQLSDGKHKMYVATMNNNQVQGTSDTVEFAIDTTPPEVDDIQLNPQTITPGAIIQIAILSEANLQQAAVIFQGEIIPLSPSLDQDDTYVGSFQAPAETGNYTADIVAVDQLGNEATEEGKISFSVVAEGTEPVTPPPPQETQETQQTQETQETHGSADENAPSQVLGVIGYGSNKRVTLVWEAATDNGIVDHYKVYYGLNPANLDKSVHTKDASTTWYIPNLDNGKEYYFAVTALDEEGMESVDKSELVSSIPFNLEITTTIPDRPQAPLHSAGGNEVILKGAALEELNEEIVKAPRGAEIIWLIGTAGSISGAVTLLKSKKRKK